MRLSRLSAIVMIALIAPLFAAAASFPDVTSSYPHRDAVLKLADMGVIGGHPDGTFKPYDPVDRASMLKMLYKAAGKTADSSKTRCFPDVAPGSWYETIVCDAVAKGYVQGYDNPSAGSGQAGKSFKPGRAVSRAEALKLSMVVLGTLSDGSGPSALPYTDVAREDWYTPYVRTAVSLKILPMSGMDGPLFKPNQPLERGQAAQYIWNALHPDTSTVVSSPASSARASSASSASRPAVTGRDKELAEQRASEEKSLAQDMANMYRQAFPFVANKTFSGKHPISFRFALSSATTVDIAAVLEAKGAVSCRLYRMLNDVISIEYYLGYQENESCFLRAAIQPGEYQLDVQGTVADAKFSVTAASVKGDGNDGFSEAKSIDMGKLRLDALDGNDLSDWFSFKITGSTSQTGEPGQNRTVTLTSGDKLGCIIYPLEDVDLFGFDTPLCNESFLYPVGTYLVNVRHAPPRAERQTYSIVVK